MNKNIIETEINVSENRIKILKIKESNYISLTDLARHVNPE